ncbi:hypothetical protein DAMA08_013290 [Martiniozyma asiatica (nom. inval.)]|nr:hypothetical protein DAMA08_013290 [Martiniozyma asiatica]
MTVNFKLVGILKGDIHTSKKASKKSKATAGNTDPDTHEHLLPYPNGNYGYGTSTDPFSDYYSTPTIHTKLNKFNKSLANSNPIKNARDLFALFKNGYPDVDMAQLFAFVVNYLTSLQLGYFIITLIYLDCFGTIQDIVPYWNELNIEYMYITSRLVLDVIENPTRIPLFDSGMVQWITGIFQGSTDAPLMTDTVFGHTVNFFSLDELKSDGPAILKDKLSIIIKKWEKFSVLSEPSVIDALRDPLIWPNHGFNEDTSITNIVCTVITGYNVNGIAGNILRKKLQMAPMILTQRIIMKNGESLKSFLKRTGHFVENYQDNSKFDISSLDFSKRWVTIRKNQKLKIAQAKVKVKDSTVSFSTRVKCKFIDTISCSPSELSVDEFYQNLKPEHFIPSVSSGSGLSSDSYSSMDSSEDSNSYLETFKYPQFSNIKKKYYWEYFYYRAWAAYNSSCVNDYNQHFKFKDDVKFEKNSQIREEFKMCLQNLKFIENSTEYTFETKGLIIDNFIFKDAALHMDVQRDKLFKEIDYHRICLSENEVGKIAQEGWIQIRQLETEIISKLKTIYKMVENGKHGGFDYMLDVRLNQGSFEIERKNFKRCLELLNVNVELSGQNIDTVPQMYTREHVPQWGRPLKPLNKPLEQVQPSNKLPFSSASPLPSESQTDKALNENKPSGEVLNQTVESLSCDESTAEPSLAVSDWETLDQNYKYLEINFEKVKTELNELKKKINNFKSLQENSQLNDLVPIISKMEEAVPSSPPQSLSSSFSSSSKSPPSPPSASTIHLESVEIKAEPIDTKLTEIPADSIGKSSETKFEFSMRSTVHGKMRSIRAKMGSFRGPKSSSVMSKFA